MKSFWSFSFLLLCFSFMTSVALAEEVNGHPKLLKQQTDALFQDKKSYNDEELVVKFSSQTSQTERNKILKLAEAKEISYLADSGFSFVKISSNSNSTTVAEQLIKNNNVLLVEPNYKAKSTYIPEEPSYNKQWYLNKIHMPKAWDITKGSSKITVAVIDDGVQQNHPDLLGKIVYPYNAVTGSTHYTPHEHATHVAGIIAASFNKKGIAGIAPNVKIMPINVFDNDEASDYSVASAIKYAVDHHADVINMSLGTESYSFLIDFYANYARSKGVFLVAAAGNSDTFAPMYPAALDSVVGVSATDRNDKRAGFSNYGKYIDFAAPGLDIYSSVTGNSYESLSGTSMAAPVLSGVAALVRSKNPLLTPDQVENVLKKSTVDLGTKGWDDYYGYGRIDAYKAVSHTPAPISTIKAPSTYTMTGKNNAAMSFITSSKTKASLFIENMSGKTVRKILSNHKLSNSKVSASWNGKNDGGKFVPSGTYKVLAKVSNTKATFYKNTTIKVVNHTYPAILISGDYAFSTHVSGKIKVPFQLTQKVSVTAVVTDKKGKTVKKILSSKPLSAGKHSLVWNGKNTNGKTMKDSTYQLILSFRDSHNKKGKTKKVSLMVDSVKPSAKLALTESIFKMDSKTNHKVNLKLNETANTLIYVVDEKGKIIKKLINKKYKAGTVTISWNGKNDKNQLVNEGKYRYLVELKDLAGNKSKIKSSLVSLQDWRMPTIQAGRDVYFKIKGKMTFDYILSKSGKVSIAIFKEDTLIKTIQKDVSELTGNQSFLWDGTDTANSQVMDGDYRFEMKIVDKYNLSQTFTGHVHVQMNQ